MTEQQTPGTPEGGKQEPQSFTQADVDRIVADRLSRERAKYADYDDLKAKAEGAKTADDRIADLEKRLADADARESRQKLVAKVAGDHKITDADDIRLFLTGSDEDTLAAQAKALAAKATAKPNGNYVPTEGATPKNPAADDVRAFTRNLFGRDSD